MTSQQACVMEGEFKNFSISDVLNVLSISRQLMLLRLQINAFTADIILKAGQVLSASTNDGEHGKDAVIRSFRKALQGHGQFNVFQLPATKSIDDKTIESISSLFKRSKLLVSISTPAREVLSTAPPKPSTSTFLETTEPADDTNASETRVVDTNKLKKSRNFNRRLDSIEILLAQLDTNGLSERLEVLETSIVKLISNVPQAPTETSYDQNFEELKATLDTLKSAQQTNQTQLQSIENQLKQIPTTSGNDSIIMEFAKNMIEQSKPGKILLFIMVGVLSLQVIGLIFTALMWGKLFLSG